MKKFLVNWFVIALTWSCVMSFKLSALHIRKNEFEPYEEGFVAQFGRGNTKLRTRINEGGQPRERGSISFSKGVKYDPENETLSFLPGVSRANQVFRFEAEGVSPRQPCSGMVGPKDDGAYYCTDENHGYCDRRYGSCFCYEGYQGDDCSHCKPTHFESIPGVCSPRILCTNDCSGAGSCDYTSGTCVCESHRTGDDCSIPFCSGIDINCHTCNAIECLKCIGRYYLVGGSCAPCSNFDPRCIQCDADIGCLKCADPLLNSVRRSGRRRIDSILPFDEQDRELSQSFAFGSKSPNYFDESESFEVLNGINLSLESVDCEQGGSFDSKWTCVASSVSHLSCGNVGTVSFDSPTYAVIESSEYLKVTVKRTGGGYGKTEVYYTLKHITTSDSDVSSSAPYTSTNKLVFLHGVVSLTFRLSVHDDYKVEPDELFQLELYDVWSDDGTASIGPQSIATVTIIDDDYWVTSAEQTQIVADLDEVIAGSSLEFQIVSKQSTGINQTAPLQAGQEYVIFSTSEVSYQLHGVYSKQISESLGSCLYDGDGQYSCSLPLHRDTYSTLNVMLARRGGLMGDFFDKAYALDLPQTAPVFSRIDPRIRFVWGTGEVIPYTKDFVAIQWKGGIALPSSIVVPTTYEFRILVNDHARVYIDGQLIIDYWIYHDSAGTGSFTLNPNTVHTIVVDYRELKAKAHVILSWKSPTDPEFSVIPPDSLMQLYHVADSPYKISIIPDEVAPQVTFATGTCLANSVAGVECSIDIHPRDAFGNTQPLQSDLFELGGTLVSPALGNRLTTGVVQGVVEFDQHRNLYIVSMTPQAAGTYDLSISHNSIEILNSPFQLIVTPGYVNGMVSEVVGDGVDSSIGHIVGLNYSVVITLRDSFGNIYAEEDMTPYIEVNAVQIDAPFYSYSGIVEYNGSGIYQVMYSVDAIGDYGIHFTIGCQVLIASAPCETIGTPPYVLRYAHQIISPRDTFASGTGIAAATSGIAASFSVYARDIFGNKVTSGSDQFRFSLMYPDDSTSEFDTSHCIYQSTDHYVCTYTPESAGDEVILTIMEVVSDEVIQDGLTFSVDISDGSCSADQSFAFGSVLTETTAGMNSVFLIQAADAAGNNRTSSCDDLQVFQISFDDGTPISYTIHTIPNSGLYEVSYVANTSGLHSLSVLFSSVPIMESPFALQVLPNFADYRTTMVFGDGLINGTVGSLQSVTIQAADEYGNNITEADESRFVLLLKISGQVVVSVDPQSNGDGTFNASFQNEIAQTPEEGEIVVLLAQAGGIDMDFFQLPTLDHKLFSRVDKGIDLTQMTEYGVEIGEDSNWSAVWNGLIRSPMAPESAEYQMDTYRLSFRVHVIGGGARFWIDDSLVFDEWPRSNREFSETFELVTVQGVYMPFRLEFTNSMERHDTQISLEWSVDPIDPYRTGIQTVPEFTVVPRDAFFRWREVYKTNPLYIPTISDALSSSLTDPKFEVFSLVHSGVEVSFGVQLRDKYFNSQIHHNDSLVVYGWELDYHINSMSETDIDGPEVIIGSAERVVSVPGQFKISFTPTLTGTFLVFIAVNPVLPDRNFGRSQLIDALLSAGVSGSPFQFVVNPGDYQAAKSFVFGPDVSITVAGETSIFFIQSVDLNNNTRDIDGDVLDVYLNLSGNSQQIVSLDYLGHGLYQVAYLVTISGEWIVSVTMKDLTTISPFGITVHPAQAHGPSCLVEFPSNTISVSSDALEEIKVVARDQFKNELNVGGNDFYLKLIVPDRFTPSLLSEGAVDIDLHQYEYGKSWIDFVDHVVDHEDGSYSFFVRMKGLLGTFNVTVALAMGHSTPKSQGCSDWFPDVACAFSTGTGGLLGHYFSRKNSEKPKLLEIAQQLDFEWVDGNGLAINTDLECRASNDIAETSMVRWTGYLKTEFTTSYEFFLEGIFLPEDASVTIAGNVLTSSSSLFLRGGLLYPVEISFVRSIEATSFRLLWRSLLGANAIGITETLNTRASVDTFSRTVYLGTTVSVSVGDTIAIDGLTFVVEHYDTVKNIIYIDRDFLNPSVVNAEMYRRPRKGRIPSNYLFFAGSMLEQSPIQLEVQ